MANIYRVTVAEVQQIFDTDLASDKIQAFIRTAHSLVEGQITPKGLLSEEELRNIELWLSAHFAAIRDPVALRSKIGDAEVWHFPASVTTAFGKGLMLTPYGQQALALDSTGSLEALGKQRGKFRAAPRENSKNFNSGLT